MRKLKTLIVILVLIVVGSNTAMNQGNENTLKELFIKLERIENYDHQKVIADIIKTASISKILKQITPENITNANIASLIKVVVRKDPNKVLPTILNVITENNIIDEAVASEIIPMLLKTNFKTVLPAVIKLINEENIINKNIGNFVIPAILNEPATYGLSPLVRKSSLITSQKSVIKDSPEIIEISKKITRNNFKRIPLETYQMLTKAGAHKKVVDLISSNLKNDLNNIVVLPYNLLDMYLVSSLKYSQYIKEIALKKLFQPHYKENINQGEGDQTPSYKAFEVYSDKITSFLNSMIQEDKECALFIYSLIQREKAIFQRKNYAIAHGRMSLKFVTDIIFMYLQDIFFGKKIDKSCHYAQHYGFPGEKYEDLQTDDPLYEYVGMSINLPESEVKNILKNGVTKNSLSYTHLQFGSDILGTRMFSSAIDYVFNNHSGSSGGAVSVESLFKKLSKVLGKDVTIYYKKYQDYFEKVRLLGEEFKHGTMLIYEFTPKMLKQYVRATSGCYGILSSISIDGFETNDAQVVLDSVIKSPDKFDRGNLDYEYFWPLTDEGTANPFNDEIKTYAFHVGEHDKKLAREIKEKIAYLFTLIRRDMAQDGIIDYETYIKEFGGKEIKSKL